jgi:hypothetical protein
MSVTQFRAKLVKQMIKKPTIIQIATINNQHVLEIFERSRCVKCYAKIVLSKGRKYAQSLSAKIKTLCVACNKYFCFNCFFEHKFANK